ncbi:MAG: DUF4214 domain-containing protein [Oscillospiraceae bacterium]|nr:DUF4214 domain-containing protein [Oscillospiraceae bacterium]
MMLKKSAVSAMVLVALLFSLAPHVMPTRADAAPAQDLTGRVIFLDPGHGIGSLGGGGAVGYTEHVRMFYLAALIKPLLEARGATVYLTRSDEYDILLQSRAAFINIIALQTVQKTYDNEADIKEIDRLIEVMQGIIADPSAEGRRLMNTPYSASRKIHPDMQKIIEYLNHPIIGNNFLLISLHTNAPALSVENPENVRGAEVLYISPTEHSETRTYFTGYAYATQSRNFADILLNHIRGVYYNGNNIPRRSNGLRAQNLMIIREVGIPGVLAENGFHTNATELALLKSNTYINSLALAYETAIAEYFRDLPLYSPQTDNQKIEDFVSRLYLYVLERTPDAAGQRNWVSGLVNGDTSGAAVAYGFFFSTEMKNRGLSDEDFVEHLYLALMGRVSDSSGKENWVNQLNLGVSRETVFAGFVNSVEFDALCKAAGILRGVYSPPPENGGGSGGNTPSHLQVEAFVTRLYAETLQRIPDPSGLEHWTNNILAGVPASTVAHGFVFSSEMNNRNLSNADFVEILYRSLLGRSSDSAGKSHWVGRLENGTPRQTIFSGFAYSVEFENICARYGVRR